MHSMKFNHYYMIKRTFRLESFYEGENIEIISEFLKEKCWKSF